jgi:hypothetical protein
MTDAPKEPKKLVIHDVETP